MNQDPRAAPPSLDGAVYTMAVAVCTGIFITEKTRVSIWRVYFQNRQAVIVSVQQLTQLHAATYSELF
jgi:hypothetical protein